MSVIVSLPPQLSTACRGALLLLAFVSSSAGLADTLLVGPGQALSRIADAARVARDGDTVLVSAGVYRRDVAVWRQKALRIRSIGGRALLLADGASAEGKAIWVLRNGRFDIRGFEFVGARAPDGNGAGIRFERGELSLADCVFRDNQMGLLTGNHGESILRIQDSWFADAPRQESSLPHLLYAGRIGRLEVTGSRFENGYRGHLVKSRARRTELRYNLIADGPDGRASYEVDLANGGEASLVGNVIVQSAGSENRTLIAYGAEGTAGPSNRLVLVHNTLANSGTAPGSFLRLSPGRQSARHPVVLRTRNNLLVGVGRPLDTLPGDHRGNLVHRGWHDSQMDLEYLRSIATRSLEAASTMRDLPPDLMPTHEPHLPLGRIPIDPIGNRLPGALQNPPRG